MDKPLILIADDDKAIRVVLEKKLNRSGFNTKSVWIREKLYYHG